eukprot:1158705-Pelagomonas_calceolata.AAC.11
MWNDGGHGFAMLPCVLCCGLHIPLRCSFVCFVLGGGFWKLSMMWEHLCIEQIQKWSAHRKQSTLPGHLRQAGGHILLCSVPLLYVVQKMCLCTHMRGSHPSARELLTSRFSRLTSKPQQKNSSKASSSPPFGALERLKPSQHLATSLRSVPQFLPPCTSHSLAMGSFLSWYPGPPDLLCSEPPYYTQSLTPLTKPDTTRKA